MNAIHFFHGVFVDDFSCCTARIEHISSMISWLLLSHCYFFHKCIWVACQMLFMSLEVMFTYHFVHVLDIHGKISQSVIQMHMLYLQGKHEVSLVNYYWLLMSSYYIYTICICFPYYHTKYFCFSAPHV